MAHLDRADLQLPAPSPRTQCGDDAGNHANIHSQLAGCWYVLSGCPTLRGGRDAAEAAALIIRGVMMTGATNRAKLHEFTAVRMVRGGFGEEIFVCLGLAERVLTVREDPGRVRSFVPPWVDYRSPKRFQCTGMGGIAR